MKALCLPCIRYHFISIGLSPKKSDSSERHIQATQQSTTESGRIEYPSLEGVMAADWSGIKRASPVLFALLVQHHALDKHGGSTYCYVRGSKMGRDRAERTA
jgi:hypothetical protein